MTREGALTAAASPPAVLSSAVSSAAMSSPAMSSLGAPTTATAASAAAGDRIRNAPGKSRVASTVAVLVVVLSIGGVLRGFAFPSRYQLRNVDETGYLAGGAQLLEGMSPGYKAAPGGPQFWAEWACLASDTAGRLLWPDARERAVPWRVRPFIALDDALFANYRDLSHLHQFAVGFNVALSLLGCCAAAGLGIVYAGWMGGLLVGGLFACWPLFVDFADQSRPYAAAWALGMMALWLAAICLPRRLWIPAIFLGLAVASRIDMLSLLPLFWWISLDRSGAGQGLGHRLSRLFTATVLAMAIAIFVAPWIMTSLIGELRTIATVRFAPTPSGHVPWSESLRDFLFPQAGLLPILLAVVAVFLQPAGRRLRTILLALLWLLFFASLLKERGFGPHQHAEVFLALLVLLAADVWPLISRFPRAAFLAIGITLLIPAAITAHAIPKLQQAYAGNDAVPWIEQHVPAGTTVYIYDASSMMPWLLPTPQSAQAIWRDVTDDQAWSKKFAAGLDRFGLSAGSDLLPRALSEENLVQERGNARGWFILGGHTDLPTPRYDIRLYRNSPIFGVQDLSAALKQKSGLILWRNVNVAPPAELGVPIIQWLDATGTGIMIFAPEDVRKQLAP